MSDAVLGLSTDPRRASVVPGPRKTPRVPRVVSARARRTLTAALARAVNAGDEDRADRVTQILAGHRHYPGGRP